MFLRLRWLGAGLLLLLVAVGCEPEESIDTGPPEGWQAEGTRWWQTGTDTTGLFRDLETLGAMGVGETVFLASPGSVGLQRQFERRVQHSLIRLYRNEPEVVDSLFRQFVVPKLPRASEAEDLAQQVERAKRQSYKALTNHFKEPLAARQLGTDVPVPYPDSLRQRQVGGAAKMQVYLDAEGAPVAIKLVEGVHPTLDAIALRATTQMRWRPAYLIRKGRWSSLPAWTRLTVRFTPA